MMRRKQALSWIAASGLVLSLAGCTGGDDSGGDTTITAGTTAPLTGGMDDDSTGGGSAPATDSSGGGNEDSTGDPPVTCDPPCAADQQCVAGQCIGGGDSSGGGECPDGEMCQMTGAMTMACLGEPTHCALPCGGGGTCPDPMVCGGGGVCEYDVMMLPMDGGNPDYPAPNMMGMCPDGFLAAAFSAGHAVCIPECDEAGMCAGGGICATNPMSSGQPC